MNWLGAWALWILLAQTGTPMGVGDAPLVPVTTLQYQPLEECSGLVRLGDAFWAHNDSGDGPILYRSESIAFTRVREFRVPGAMAVDWEDIAVLDGDLLACDIGDNRRVRPQVTLYRARYHPAGEATPDSVSLVSTITVTYPDGAHDAEACFVRRGFVYLVTKDRGEGTLVYRFPTPPADRAEVAVTPEPAGTLYLGEGEQVTAGDYDPERDLIVLLTYSSIVVYPGDTFDGLPMVDTRILARQSEAICIAPEGGIVLTNEQRDVFVLRGYLDRLPEVALPPLGSANLPREFGSVPVDGSGGAWPEPGEVLHLQNQRPGEFVRWLAAGDRLHLAGRLVVESTFRPTPRMDPGIAEQLPYGSGVFLAFGHDDKRWVTDDEVQLALTRDESGAFHLDRLDVIDRTRTREVFAGAEVQATVADGWLTFEVALPTAELFGGMIPQTFRFDLRGFKLRRGEEAYFSGPDVYSFRRPYVWGTVTRD